MNNNTKKISINVDKSKSQKRSYNRSYKYKSKHSKKKYKPDPNIKHRERYPKSLNNNEKKKSKTKFEDVCLGEVVIKKSPTKNAFQPEIIQSPKETTKKEIAPIPRIERPIASKTSLNNSSRNNVQRPSKESEPQLYQKIVKVMPKSNPVQVMPRTRSHNISDIKSPKIAKEVNKKPPQVSRIKFQSKDPTVGKRYNLEKKEFPNKVKNHKQGILDRYYGGNNEKTMSNPKSNKQRSPVAKKASPTAKKVSPTAKKVSPTAKKVSPRKTISPVFRKIKIKTNMQYYRNVDKYVRGDLLEKNIDNAKFYKNIPDIEDKYLTSIITEGVNIKKISHN